MQMTPYLNFAGNCREAFEFYRDVLGGEITGSPSAWVALNLDTAAEAERVFAAFSDGAEVHMDLQQTFWAEKFAMLVDRFGTAWIINGNLTEEHE
jgi:PhnB protein